MELSIPHEQSILEEQVLLRADAVDLSTDHGVDVGEDVGVMSLFEEVIKPFLDSSGAIVEHEVRKLKQNRNQSLE